MNVLIIHAHENPYSFSYSLAEKAKEFFENEGHSVTISDLYKKQFNPVASKNDFTETSEATYYKYALEQLNANSKNLFSEDLKEEMKLLENADVLILNFPLWWFGFPAILKGWVDRVLAYGFAYGGEHGIYKDGKYKEKQAFLCTTTGSPASFYNKNGIHGRSAESILQNINQGILELIGFKTFAPFIGYAVSRISDSERKVVLDNYHTYLKTKFT